LIIDNYKFSLKEESFILENMGLYKLLNILLNTNTYNSGMHVFKEFANTEFENWFHITCNCLLKDGPTTFNKVRTNKYNVTGKLFNNSMMLNYNSSEIVEFDDISHLQYEEFAKRTNSHLREYVFSKWIKAAVENDENYIQSKKLCAITAGQNLLKSVKPCEKTSPQSLLRFFRIIDKEYYYAKTTNNSLAIYKVPPAQEASKHIVINNISFEVPKSQLNFYTEILNIKNGNKIVFRNELRYSHGQFNGTPEAKCYIDKKFQDLSIMYERLV